MSHILMVAIGAHGHLNPHLPVLAELVERGHRVSVVVPEPFADIAASSGATPLIVASELPDETRGERWPDGGVEAMELFLDEGRDVLPQLESALDSDRPDAVLYDIGGYAGRALAHRWQLPLLQLSPSMVAWEGYEEDMAEARAFLDTPRGRPTTPGRAVARGTRHRLRRRHVHRTPTTLRRADPEGHAIQRRPPGRTGRGRVPARRGRHARVAEASRAVGRRAPDVAAALAHHSAELRAAGGAAAAADIVERML